MTSYSNRNLIGQYWFRKVGGIPQQDALGTINFDGVGRFEGLLILNTGGGVVRMSHQGGYDLQSDGTGTFTWDRILPGGGTEQMHSHVVVMRTDAAGEIITEIYSSIDAPDPSTGELNGRLIVRQPTSSQRIQ